jgi:hypothetical protein
MISARSLTLGPAVTAAEAALRLPWFAPRDPRLGDFPRATVDGRHGVTAGAMSLAPAAVAVTASGAPRGLVASLGSRSPKWPRSRPGTANRRPRASG